MMPYFVLRFLLDIHPYDCHILTEHAVFLLSTYHYLLCFSKLKAKFKNSKQLFPHSSFKGEAAHFSCKK